MNHEISTEPDRVPSSLIIVTAVVTAVAIACSAVAVWLLANRDATGGGASPPTRVLPVEVDAVTTEPFELVLTAERTRAVQTRELDQWSWRDRAHRIVHVPIAVAIDLYLERPR